MKNVPALEILLPEALDIQREDNNIYHENHYTVDSKLIYCSLYLLTLI